jgi:hypothetical protein
VSKHGLNIHERFLILDSDIAIDGRHRVSRLVPCLSPNHVDSSSGAKSADSALRRMGQFDATEYTNEDGNFCYNKWKIKNLSYGSLRAGGHARSSRVATDRHRGLVIITIRRVKDVIALPPGGVNYAISNDWHDEWDQVRIDWEVYRDDQLSHAMIHGVTKKIDVDKDTARTNAILFARSHDWKCMDSKEKPFATFALKYRCASGFFTHHCYCLLRLTISQKSLRRAHDSLPK